MALIDEYTAALNQTFINRCLMAAVAFAINIIESEVTTTPNHPNRAAYAKAVVAAPNAYAPSLAQGVIALNASSDGSTLTDTVVNNSIASIWNIYAGII